MKQWNIVLCLMFLLSGCGSVEEKGYSRIFALNFDDTKLSMMQLSFDELAAAYTYRLEGFKQIKLTANVIQEQDEKTLLFEEMMDLPTGDAAIELSILMSHAAVHILVDYNQELLFLKSVQSADVTTEAKLRLYRSGFFGEPNKKRVVEEMDQWILGYGEYGDPVQAPKFPLSKYHLIDPIKVSDLDLSNNKKVIVIELERLS